MNIIAIPILSDNYVWMLHNEEHAIVVDPGDATPVIQALQKHQLQLAAILVTHHHEDHVGGITALRPYLQKPQGKVWGPASEAIPKPFEPLKENTPLELLGLKIQVLDVPGHTSGHIAYYIPEQVLLAKTLFEPLVFTGDTLFSGGCGRLFEGTPDQMLNSLKKLAALPSHTRVYCAHEYTLSNLRFAQAVEPHNQELLKHIVYCEQLRQKGLATLPSTINKELKINPFLRTHNSTIIKAIQAHTPSVTDEVSAFAVLRQWKDNFK